MEVHIKKQLHPDMMDMPSNVCTFRLAWLRKEAENQTLPFVLPLIPYYFVWHYFDSNDNLKEFQKCQNETEHLVTREKMKKWRLSL